MTTKNPGKEVLTELYNGQMLNYRQIGEKYGVSVRAVQKWFKALGIPARNPGYTIAKNRKQGKRGRPPKRPAVVAGGRAIDRLSPADQVLVRENVTRFLAYAQWTIKVTP